MRRLTFALTAVAAAVLQAGCSDPARVTQPGTPDALAARGGGAAAAADVRRIQMMDACDPASFDAVLGTGACVRQGGVTFTKFIDQLGKHGSIGAWHFAPGVVQARVGQTLLAINHGGEEHTFTEVEEFGGGIVPLLNELSGNPEVAPECTQLAPSDFIPAGGTATDEVSEPGTELYQCCIHPWMRTTVRARER